MSQFVEFQLPETLTIASVQSLHEQFEALIEDKNLDSLVLKAADVQRIDTSGVQLLYALVLAAQERQITLKWQAPSSALRHSAQVLGLAGLIGIH